jgi:hypothetical protein
VNYEVPQSVVLSLLVLCPCPKFQAMLINLRLISEGLKFIFAYILHGAHLKEKCLKAYMLKRSPCNMPVLIQTGRQRYWFYWFVNSETWC